MSRTDGTESTARVTVHEVAARAGVSIASVSRVLNGKGGRPATEQAVRAAAAALGYVPDSTGRALKLGTTTQFAFAVDDLANPVYTQMMRGVEEGLAHSGARLLVSSTGHDPHDLMALVDSLSRGYCDGLIISPLRRTDALLSRLAQAPVPVVVIGDVGGFTGLDAVRTESRAGVGLAFDHLVSTGRRRIAFVNGPSDTTPGRTRLQGYQRACRRHGLCGPVVQAKEFTVAAGETAWSHLPRAADGSLPDAVIAANDLLAIGVMRAALAEGRRVPADLAVVGVDDIELAGIYSPSLTTISLGAQERGRVAAELLLARRADPLRPPQQHTTAPELVIRESTGVARSTATSGQSDPSTAPDEGPR